jgi:integrase
VVEAVVKAVDVVQPTVPACPLPITYPTLGEEYYLKTISEKTVAEVEVLYLDSMLTCCHAANGLLMLTDGGKGGVVLDPALLRKRHFASLLKRAGLPADTRFHDLRHTCATLLLGKGVHPKFVQELLGHANIAITLDTYLHVILGMGDPTARAMEDAPEGEQPGVQDAEDA